MNSSIEPSSDSRYLWPLAVLFFLTVGVFVTTREIPNQQEVRSHAQVNESEPTQAQPEVQDVVINISFSLPGIASQGGNITPTHPTRDVTLFFYDRDSNTADPNITPLFTLKTTVEFDDNMKSPTYAKFIHNNLSLAGVVPNGTYQVGVKAGQSLIKIFKVSDAASLGIPVSIGILPSFDIAFGKLLSGDIVPLEQGNNTIDIADYNELSNCFGKQFETPTCTAKTNADLDDNGVVDGIDYNILLRSIISLPHESIAPIVSPSSVPTKIVQPTVTVVPNQSIPVSNTLGGKFVLMATVIVIFLAGVIMLFRKTFPSFPLPQINGKVYFISQSKTDEKGWFTLADDNKQMRGHYEGGEVKDGFARIHGKTKVKDGLKYLEISKISWEN